MKILINIIIIVNLGECFSVCRERSSGVNEGEEEDEEEELGHTDTYAEYVPSKCKAVSYVF